MSDNNHVYEIIGKDPFNIKILNETLWDIKESIFNNLYDAQRSLSNIIRFDFDMANMTRLTDNECIYNLNMQFITNRSRTKFKQSNFYKKDLSPDDINSNADIFSNTALVFINGEMYTNFYVRPMENITSIVFKLFDSFPKYNNQRYVRKGFSKVEMNQFIESHTKLTILIVKSHNTSIVNSTRGTVRNYTLVPKYNGMPLVNFENMNNISETEIFTTWMTYDDERLYKYKFIKTVKNSENRLLFDKQQVIDLTNSYVDIRNLFLLDHFQTITLPPNTEYFELPIKDMPIPIENILVFRNVGNDVIFDQDINITLHYPNIYRINNIRSEELLLYVYYADDTKSLGNKYDNELHLYYRFTYNVLEEYKNKTVPEIIEKYTPIAMDYDHDDLDSSKLDHLTYRMNKLNSMIHQNGNYYSIYLHKLIGYVPTFDIDVSEIDDLSSRYRVNNKLDISDSSLHTTFSEPCYVFTFRCDKNDKINILIDAYQTNELYVYYVNKYCYVYIPTRLVNDDSLITVEKFVDYRYKQTITINNEFTYHKLNIPDHQTLQLSDIYVSYESTNTYMPKEDYEIYIKINNLYTKVTINDFYRYKDIYIKFINPSNIGKKVFVNVNRISFKQTIKGSNEVIINREINNDKRNILLYRNGRLIPQKIRVYDFSDNVTGPHKVKALMKQYPDDEYTLIYNTNKYFMVYYQRTINEKGIVNLDGKINKPLDFKWYDIYLNGLRLHKSNIEIVGPYIFLLKNVPTLTNLEIYQKNLDSLTWDNDYSNDDISSNIYDEIFKDIEEKLPTIDDTIPDILDDMLYEIIDFFDEYLWSIIKLINPDVNQITQIMIDNYPTLFINDDNLFLNPDSISPTDQDVMMNPDTNSIIMV